MWKASIGILAVLMASNVCAGEYRLSKGWPIGIGARIFTMPPGQEKECQRLASEALRLSNATEPLKCGLLEATGVPQLRPNWSRVEGDKAFILYEKLQTLYETRTGPNLPRSPWTEQQRQALRNAIANGDTVVESCRVPLYGDGQEVTLIRRVGYVTQHQPEHCNNAPDWMLNSVMWGRIADNGDVGLLSGLGRASEAFLWTGRVYLISYSTRDFDDSFRYRLKPPQPEIYVHVMRRGQHPGENIYMPQCRFLYWDRRAHPSKKS